MALEVGYIPSFFSSMLFFSAWPFVIMTWKQTCILSVLAGGLTGLLEIYFVHSHNLFVKNLSFN